MPGSRLPDLPSASPTPETLPHTALAPPPSVPAPRPAPLERMQVRLALALQVASGDGSVRQAFHLKRIFVFSLNSNLQLGPVDQVGEDRRNPRNPRNLRPPVPNTPLLSSQVLTTSVPGFLVKAPPHKPTLDTCPSLPTLDRWAMLFLLQSAPAEVPTTKTKGADKGTFKGKDKSPSNWPPLNLGPPKGFSKGSPKGLPEGLPKGPDKGKSLVKGLLHLPFCQSFPSGPSLSPTVRLVPYLPLLFALYTFPSLFFLSLGLSLSLRAWLVSSASLWAFSQFSPFWGQPGILSGSSLLSLFYVLSFPPPLLSPFCPPSSPSLFSRCLPKAASPNVATPYDPKRSLAAMSWAYLRWYTHALQPLSYTPPMLVVPPTLLAARGYLTPSSLGTLLYNIYRALIHGFLSLLPFSPLEALLITATHLTKKKNKKKWGGASLGILSGSSSGAHSFLHHSFIVALLHTDFCLSLSCISQLLPIFSLGLYVLACPQEHLLSCFDSYILSPYLKFSWCDLHVSLSVL